MFRLDLLDSCDYSNGKSFQAAVLFRLYRILFIKCSYETRQVESAFESVGKLLKRTPVVDLCPHIFDFRTLLFYITNGFLAGPHSL